MTETQQPEALAQECADYATSLLSTVNLVQLTGKEPPQSMLRAADIFERASADIRRLHARVQELEASQARVREIAVSALLTGSRDRQDWIDDMARIDGITQEKQR